MKFAGYGVFVGKIEEIMKYATESLPGIIEIATQAEVDAGVDDTRAVTPKKQKTFVDAQIAAIPEASESEAGKIEIATQGEVDAGSDDARAVTPLKQKTFVDAQIAAIPDASETEKGKVELATDAETQDGTDTTRAITPANLAACTATSSRKGVLELATNGETQIGTDSTRAVTPASLKACTATESRNGVAEIATQTETDTGTDDSRIVTPLKLKNFSGILGYCINGSLAATFDPADNTTYAINTAAPVSGLFGTRFKIPIPKTGTIKKAIVSWYASSVAGTSESISCYIRLNNSSDTLIASVADTSNNKTFSNYSLSISVTEGDYIEIKLTTPSWSTNPTAVYISWSVYIES
jgi:hypothetical protein